MPTGNAPNLHAAAIELEDSGRSSGAAARIVEIAPEIVGILLRLHAHEIVMAERPQRLGMLGQSLQNVRRRTGNMKEEANRIVVPPRPEFLGERQADEVVDPDRVVGQDETETGLPRKAR